MAARLPANREKCWQGNCLFPDMRIMSVELFSRDLEATANFYDKVLRFPVRSQDQNRLQLRAGFSDIVFRKAPSGNPVYHMAFAVSRSVIDETASFLESYVELLKAEGKKVIDFDAWDAKAIYFEDNNGNILELIGRDNTYQDLQPVSSTPPVYGVCEVAIVTDSVETLRESVGSGTGITRYNKQPVHENFAALGDDEGLLILSSQGRHWFPTEVPAEKFPVTAVVEHNGQCHTLRFNE